MAHVREEDISAYIDSQLYGGEKLELESHLRECAECRAVFEEMSEMTRLFREAERVAPSAFLWNRIEAGLAERRPARAWGAFIPSGLHAWGRSLGAATAALAVCLAAGLAIMHQNARRAAERAALEIIDQTHKSLAAQDPEFYNPFSSGSLRDLEGNPFRAFRLGGGKVPER
jgi:anti-sigma factor RsiW